ncbi:MAG: glycoside hydrolase family 30 protein [Asticcacaulis sp.]
MNRYGSVVDRRQFIYGLGAASTSVAVMAGMTTKAQAAALQAPAWFSTRKGAAWVDQSAALGLPSDGGNDLYLTLDKPRQKIEGFGACFNELGWDALSALKPDDREAILYDLFDPAGSCKFNRCRMPLGANDFSRDWYSYDETPGDFSMAHFNMARDEKALIPFIHAAQAYSKDLSLWGSPWSPPTWMKTNGHYAQAMSSASQPANGLRPDQVVIERQNGFIQDDKYFKAYALYFRKFLDQSHKRGLPVNMVMPQNEFNSSQTFPSCVWTPEALARFIPHLGEAIGSTGTEIFLGTLERPDPQLFERIYADPKAAPHIKGIGMQWAGKGAAPFLGRDYPQLRLYQTEQECGDGRNDWRYARYTWSLMKTYFEAGVSVYSYWNIALLKDRASTWGWRQNSLVVVDPVTQTYTFTPDYYVLKHLCHFVQPGAYRVDAVSWTGYDNALAFQNPDGSLVAIVQNDQPDDLPIRIGMGGRVLAATLPPASINTFKI